VYPAREAPIPGVTGERVANAARDRGVQTVYEPVRDALGERVAPLLNAGDVVLTLGAGDITRLGPELRGRLARA
jgi:UDP-N-acetylmuramate--alanine ligase